MARLHRRHRKHKRHGSDAPVRKHNPPLLTEIWQQVVPGFSAFAVTRFSTRIAAVQIAKWKPSWAKHAGAIASVGSFLAAWQLAHRVKWLAKYQAPLMVGSALAAIQSLIQLYIPQLGMLIADASPQIASSQQQQQLAAQQQANQLPADLTPVDEDPNAFVYNDSYDAGRYASGQTATNTGTSATAPSSSSSTQPSDEELLADLDLSESQGIFSSAGN